MGVVNTISFDKFPRQRHPDGIVSYGVGSRVRVCYNYDVSNWHLGTIVRDDAEEPFETIIQLDNGNFVRSTECQFSVCD